MCLAVPSKIIEINDALAKVEVDGVVRVMSLGDGTSEKARTAEMECTELVALTEQGYDALGDRLTTGSEDPWAAYVIGVLAVLRREHGVALEDGRRVLVRSEVPEGKGVSSSAALEVASMAAIAALGDRRASLLLGPSPGDPPLHLLPAP